MNYLYGDSSASDLKSNFLEFLRDALDFSVFVLQADARIEQGHRRIQELEKQADAESERLERFIASVSRAVESGEKGEPDSPTARCGARLASLIADAHRSSLDGIRQSLADAIARINAEEAATREACLNALGTLLAPHDPPGSERVMKIALGDAGRYEVTLDAKGEPALTWTLQVGIPDGHEWSTLLRVERLVPQLEIRAPQLAGWITKEVKIRPQRIERHIVTKLVDDTETVTFGLRTESTPEVGFDFEVSPERRTVKATRVGPPDDGSVGPFELQVEDVPQIVDLATKLRDSLAGVERMPKISATFEDTDFRTLPGFVAFVERLVEMMAPIVLEISQRSLTPNELVLRQLLSNNRREEIFVAKATLREKLAVLPEASRALFAPLALDPTDRAKKPAASSDRPPVRSELPPSAPPPKLPSAPKAPAAPTVPAPASSTAAVASSSRQASAPPAPPTGRTLSPPQGAPPQAAPAIPAKPASPVPAAKRHSEAPQVEVVEEIEMSSDALLDAVPDSSRDLVQPEGGAPRNESLVTALKKIMMLSKNGRAAEAYQEYENLFSSTAFAAYRPDEQRQALKLMVLAKSHPEGIEGVVAAHRAALVRLKALVEASAEPADQELLGVTHLFLGDEKAATAAFQAGLDVERARNPQSDLIASLMRRVSQI
jgi:hypothetical protein